jgi:hypothetical protein
MTRAAPARVLNATFVVNAARPAFVSYRVQVTINAPADQGTVTLQSDRAAPPTTVISGFTLKSGDAGDILIASVCGFIMPGENVRIVTVANVGAPTFSIQDASEVVL